MSSYSGKEGNIEKEEITELKELTEALQILLNFQKKYPELYAGHSPVERARFLLNDAKKHNNDIAARSEKLLGDLHYSALHGFKSNYSAFIMKEEDVVISTTLNISSRITLLIAQLNRLLEMMGQSFSYGAVVRNNLKPYRIEMLQTVIHNLNELINVVRKLAAMEEDLKRKI